MADNRVVTATYQAESRGWLWGPHGTEPGTTPSVTLDISKFTAGTHYPLGFIPSGCALGKVTATGLYGPYTSGASDGTQNFAGLLFDTETVKLGQTKATNAMLVHGYVDPLRLPFQSGTGSVDSAAKTASPLIYWA